MEKYRVTFDVSHFSATGVELMGAALNVFIVSRMCEVRLWWPLLHLDTSSDELKKALIDLRAKYIREFAER